MSLFNNQVGVRVEGNGNQVHGNKIINNNHEHHHHHNRRSKKKDVRGEAAAVFIAVMTVALYFHQHAYEVYFYIKTGALISMVSFMTVLPWAFTKENFYKVGLVLLFSILALMLGQYGVEMLSPEVLYIGQNSTSVTEFIRKLSEYQHGFIMALNGLIGALAVASAVLISIFAGLSILWFSIVDKDVEYVLSHFNIKRFGILMATLLAVAWLFVSGFLLQVIQ